MSNSSTETDEENILWQYIALDAYEIPPKLLKERVKSGFSSIIGKLIGKSRDEEYQPFDELTCFTSNQLDRIVPHPDWHQAVTVIDTEIQEFLENNQTKKVLVFIEKPYSGNEEILRHWAAHNDYEIIEPPNYSKLLDDPDAIVEDMKKKLEKRSILIPDLQNYFLRHQQGLDLIRKLNTLFSKYEGEDPLIIGCQSYAWEFYTEILHADLGNMEIRIQQALNDADLEKWLLALNDTVKKRRLIYRQGQNGHYLFSEQVNLISKNPDKEKIDDSYLKNLASYSLGLPLVAKEIWKKSLRVIPEDDFDLEAEIEEKENEVTYTIWVIPWNKVSFPDISHTYSRSELFVIHALLLHSGLALEWLDRLIPMTINEIYAILRSLSKIGIVEQNDSIYTISKMEYPNVRSTLETEGFLVDRLNSTK